MTIAHFKGKGECYIVGTLFKKMKLKPQILDEYLKDGLGDKGGSGLLSYVGEDDSVVLEETTGRVSLIGDAVRIKSLVTGVVVAARGEVNRKGEFVLKELLEPGTPPAPSLPMAEGEERYVALVSGLGVGAPGARPLEAQLLVDFLTGQLGGDEERRLCSRVCRVVVAGNSVCAAGGVGAGGGASESSSSKREAPKLGAPIGELDLLLAELASALPVDLMPGATDPANAALPQQPMHAALFPRAASYSTFRCVTNPHELKVGGAHLLGTAGQPLDDMARMTEGQGRVELLESSLKWRHLVPTAPDSLPSYPYSDDDPFVIAEAPHVLFAANQPKFETKMVDGVRLVCVPDFSRTQQLVLLNLATLECRIMGFSTAAANAADAAP